MYFITTLIYSGSCHQSTEAPFADQEHLRACGIIHLTSPRLRYRISTARRAEGVSISPRAVSPAVMWPWSELSAQFVNDAFLLDITGEIKAPIGNIHINHPITLAYQTALHH